MVYEGQDSTLLINPSIQSELRMSFNGEILVAHARSQYAISSWSWLNQLASLEE
jgi:hypothetical protein